MGRLGEHLYQQFGGDVPATPQEVARAAIGQYGSGRAAGRALGVDEKTIRRWKNGETVRSGNVERIARDTRATKADAHTGPIGVRFKQGNRDRTLTFGNGAGGQRGLKPGAADRVKDAYVAGDKDRMAAEFAMGVDDAWYRMAFLRGLEAEEAGRGVDLADSPPTPVFVI